MALSAMAQSALGKSSSQGVEMEALTLIAFLVLAGIDWAAVSRGEQGKPAEYVAKPAALAVLLLFACTGEDPSFWLVAALAFSLLGDVYLMLPGNLFAAGLIAFLLAHGAYIADFEGPYRWRLLWLAVILVLTIPVTRRLLSAIGDDAQRPAVAFYMLVISFMVASALASGGFFAIAGALLFFVSDGLLAWNRFVRPISQAHLYVMVTYHLGQLGLVLALRNG